jgi:ElaA protein
MINFKCKKFQELSLDELYALMVIRQEVFIVEQDCVYLDADNKDQGSWHLLGYEEPGVLVAYLRISPKGISYDNYPSMGRVLTSKKVRRKGAGKELIAQALIETDRFFPGEAIKISAQKYLLHFYQSFGFETIGEEYLEDGIPHFAMIRKGDS